MPQTHTIPRPVVLLFPGQGSQHDRMALDLYRRNTVFTNAFDAAVELMGGVGKQARADWLSERPVIGIDDVRRAQPLLFAVDYALGRTVHSWGVAPTAMLGHSAGEVVAATLAGVFSLAEAARVVRDRVRCAVPIPAGGMLAVAAGADDVRPLLIGDVAVAAVNSRRQTMLAGSSAPLARVRRRLADAGYTVAPVPATSPFHSPAMAPAAEQVRRSFSAFPKAPTGVVYSGYTAGPLGARDATDPAFWSRQLTDPVLFGPALARLLDEVGDAVLVEAGPGQTLTMFARRHPSVRTGRSSVLPLLPAAGTDHISLLAVAEALQDEGHQLHPTAIDQLRQDAKERD